MTENINTIDVPSLPQPQRGTDIKVNFILLFFLFVVVCLVVLFAFSQFSFSLSLSLSLPQMLRSVETEPPHRRELFEVR
jgi:hypothetical protein